jgi:hypothetical protein
MNYLDAAPAHKQHDHHKYHLADESNISEFALDIAGI